MPDRIASVRQLFYSRIVTCCNIVCSDLHAPRKKRFPFYITVTRNARIWCPAMQIFIHKIIDYLLLKILLEIHHIIRNADLCRNFSGIIYRAESTASAVFFLYFRFFVLPDLHRHTDHIISLFFQKICRYR